MGKEGYIENRFYVFFLIRGAGMENVLVYLVNFVFIKIFSGKGDVFLER